MSRHASIAVVTIVFVLTLSSAAAANVISPSINFPKGGLSVGPAVAFVPADGGGAHVSIDAALCFGIFSISGNVKMMTHKDDLLFGGGMEATVFVGLNLGGGVGYLAGHDVHGVALNTFVGAPVPLELLGIKLASKLGRRFKMIVLEPYYRLNWFNGGYSHEIGLMVKITNFSL